MKIKYNPFDVNSLTIAAIKFANNRSATLEVDFNTTVKQSPKAYMEKNMPGEKVPLVVHILSTSSDDRHKALSMAVKVRLGDLNNTSVFAWVNLFDNDLNDVTEMITMGGYYVEAIDYLAKGFKLPGKLVSSKKPATKKKTAPKKKEGKKTVDYSKLKSTELRKLAQKKGIKGYSRMKKADIIKLL